MFGKRCGSSQETHSSLVLASAEDGDFAKGEVLSESEPESETRHAKSITHTYRQCPLNRSTSWTTCETFSANRCVELLRSAELSFSHHRERRYQNLMKCSYSDLVHCTLRTTPAEYDEGMTIGRRYIGYGRDVSRRLR